MPCDAIAEAIVAVQTGLMTLTLTPAEVGVQWQLHSRAWDHLQLAATHSLCQATLAAVRTSDTGADLAVAAEVAVVIVLVAMAVTGVPMAKHPA